jgi:ribonuclease inhibitor
MTRTDNVIIDLGSINSARTLHEVLHTALGFPEWCGHNWDAFWDAITGLVEMPARIEFLGWAIFEERMPNDARILHAALTDMSADYPEWAAEVIYK